MRNVEYLTDVEKRTEFQEFQKEIRHVLNWELKEMSAEKTSEPNNPVKILHDQQGLEPVDPFFQAMRPLVLWYRLIGRFPYTYSPDGKLQICAISKWGLYWVTVFGVQTWLSVLGIWNYVIDLEDESSFLKIIQASLNISMLLIQVLGILPVVFEGSKTAAYFNEWAEFQEEFQLTTGKVFVPRSGRVLRGTLTLTPFLVGSVVYFQKDILFKNQWYTLIPYFVIFIICHLQIFLWVFSLREICAAGSALKHKLLKIVSGRGVYRAAEICRLRMLWLRLSNLVKRTGSTFAMSMVIMVILNGFSFVTASFALLATFKDENATFKEFLSVVFITGVLMTIICEYGERTAEQVGTEIAQTISSYDMANQGQEISHELDVFIQVINSNYPTVSFAGFTVVNRTTITSSIATIVTYLIVLLQFQLSTD